MPLPEVLPIGTRGIAFGYRVTDCARLVDARYYRGTWVCDDEDPKESEVDYRNINWTHYRAQQAQAEPLDELQHEPVRGRVVARYKRAEEPFVPSAGERAVLVASPDECDAAWIGSEFRIKETRPDGHPRRYWRTSAGGPDVFIHRDATWRRAEPQGEAKPARDVTIRRNARPVEPAAGVATPPRRFATPAEALTCLRETIAEECHQEHPAHDAIEALETIEANPVRPEHAVTLPERFEALSKRVGEQGAALIRLDRALTEAELQGRVLKMAILDTRYGGLRDERAHQWFARIEREERTKAHTGANPPTKT